MRIERLFSLAAAVSICSMAPLAIAQITAGVTGTIHDASGAVIPNAKIVVFNKDRGINRESVSNSSGDYLVQGLGEGTYSVKVTAKGFQSFLAENQVMRVGQNIRVDATLSIGSSTTEVTVQGSSAGTVETQSSELSTTITSKQISQLELNGRSFTQLIELSPGVSNQTGTTDPVNGPGQGVGYSVNGGRTEYNNWEIDGGDVLDSGSMSNLNVLPNVDALDQVQVFTSSYDAQYGRSGSGAIEAVTKSGTNEFHGEAFEYLRNQMFNAKNYFDIPGERIGAYKKHDFGGTIGGPIIKDKLFFFWSEEFRRQNVPGFYSTPVPTAAQRAGDYSQGSICPAPGTVFYRSTTVYPDCPAYMDDAAQDGGVIGFPNNNLSAYIDHANAGAFLNYIPQANSTLNGLPYFREAAGAPYTSREELFKIDYNISEKLHASFRYIHDAEKLVLQTSAPFGSSNLPGIPGQQVQPGISLVANLLWTASNTLTNEFMMGYGANHLSLTDLTSAANKPAGLTMTSLFPNNFGGKVPSFNINGGASFGDLNQDAGPLPFYNSNPTYTYRDTVTKLLHAHNLKTGFYFTANQKNEDAELRTQGYLGFSGIGSASYTSPATDGQPSSTGNAFADFLVGDIASYAQSNAEPKYHFQFKIFEPFVQDDWHVNKKLTLNLGLRLSMFGLYTEKNNLAYNFDPAAYKQQDMPTVDPDNGNLVFAPGQSIYNLSGIVRCGVTTGVPKGCMTGHIWNPAPRIGFAYDPFGDGKTAIRAAYGIFFEHTNGNEANAESLEGQPPAVITSQQNRIQGYTNIGGGGGLYYPITPNSIPDKVQWPYIQQYHFDIQRELTHNTIATVSYVGSKGTHLTQQYDANQLHDLPASENPFPKGQPITNDICATTALPNGTPITGDALIHLNIACGNVNTVDSFRQNFPGWSTIDRITFGANSNYNALQVSSRRTANNLELTLAYTYSHSIDNSSDRYDGNFVDSYNLKASRASSNSDQRHILNFSYIYTLPTLSQFNRATRLALGGWQWSGITEIQTGDPLSITDGYFGDNAGVANGEGTGSYVDVAPGVSKTHITGPKVQNAIYGPLLFNPAAYNEPTGLTFGNSGRNSLHGPRTSNFDMGVFKHFPIHEKVTAEFRAEAFNVFNHTQFTSLNTGYSTGINNSPGCFGPNAGFANNAGNNICVNGDPTQGILPSGFLHPGAAHDPRIVQFALKILF